MIFLIRSINQGGIDEGDVKFIYLAPQQCSSSHVFPRGRRSRSLRRSSKKRAARKWRIAGSGDVSAANDSLTRRRRGRRSSPRRKKEAISRAGKTLFFSHWLCLFHRPVDGNSPFLFPLWSLCPTQSSAVSFSHPFARPAPWEISPTLFRSRLAHLKYSTVFPAASVRAPEVTCCILECIPRKKTEVERDCREGRPRNIIPNVVVPAARESEKEEDRERERERERKLSCSRGIR
jgi:hypothetical protein